MKEKEKEKTTEKKRTEGVGASHATRNQTSACPHIRISGVYKCTVPNVCYTFVRLASSTKKVSRFSRESKNFPSKDFNDQACDSNHGKGSRLSVTLL